MYRGHIEIPSLSIDFLNLGHGEKTNARIVLDPPKVHLQTAVGGTQLGEVLVHARHTAAQIRFLFNQVDLEARLGGFRGGTQTAHTATHHKNGPVSVHRISHRISFVVSSCLVSIPKPSQRSSRGRRPHR
jgi:hypothetical protein